MAQTASDISTEMDAVWSQMQSLRAKLNSEEDVHGRRLKRIQLAELREQYDWLKDQYNRVAGTHRTLAVEFGDPAGT